jgi:hypothetical protein
MVLKRSKKAQTPIAESKHKTITQYTLPCAEIDECPERRNKNKCLLSIYMI